MGYKRKLYHLTWPEDHQLHGLEVTTKGLTVERLFTMTGLAQGLGGGGEPGEQAATATKLFAEFAKCLVSWNLEEDGGEAVPATAEGVADQDMGFMIGLIVAWMDAIAGVDTPLPAASPSGPPPADPALEESLPVAPLSLAS